MQLDLFTDSRDVVLQNDAIAALRGGDLAAARLAFDALAAEFPGHVILAPLATLLETQAVPERPFVDHAAAQACLHVVDTVVTPAAERVFGRDAARDWLAAVWRGLAQAADDLSFHPEHPRTHPASLWLAAGEWESAEARVATIPSWRRIPLPLAWMAQARFHRAGLESAWCLLVELAWTSPAVFREVATRLPSPPLHKLLQAFETDLGDDGTPDPAWFPAWLLVRAPETASVLRETQPGSGAAPERAARLVMELLVLEKQGSHASLVALRRKLQGMHPTLYGRYMASR